MAKYEVRTCEKVSTCPHNCICEVSYLHPDGKPIEYHNYFDDPRSQFPCHKRRKLRDTRRQHDNI